VKINSNSDPEWRLSSLNGNSKFTLSELSCVANQPASMDPFKVLPPMRLAAGHRSCSPAGDRKQTNGSVAEFGICFIAHAAQARALCRAYLGFA
jgi:hypothetical protein